MIVFGQCDRCQRGFKGSATEFFTAGFYLSSPYWEEFCNPGERIVCEPCMHSDYRYIAVYGDAHGVPFVNS